MLSFLSSIKVYIIGCVLAASMFIGGCSENPQSAADKKVQAAVDAALKEFASTRDFDKAQKVLTQALGGMSGGAEGQETVLLVNGSLKYGKAEKVQGELAPLSTSIEKNLDDLTKIAGQMSQSHLEKMQIESDLRNQKEEKRHLGVQLDGDPNTKSPGLSANLKNAQDKLTALKSQQNQLNSKLSEKLKQAASLQRQADELLAKAELAKGDDKAQLQKQAYDILLGTGGGEGKNAYLAAAQEFQDQLAAIESEIATIEPQVAASTAAIEKIRKRIDELDKSDFVAKSNEHLTAISSSLSRQQEEFSDILGQIEQTQSQVAAKIKQITELLLSVQKDLKKINGDESLREFAHVATGEALLSEADTRGNYALFQRNLSARLTILASGEAMESTAQLKTLAQRYFEDSDDFVSKAITDYNEASNLFSKIQVRKDEFGIAVLKNHILILAKKAYLAERIDNIDIKNSAISQAKGLMEKAVKFDPALAQTLNGSPYSILGGVTVTEVPAAEEKKTANVPVEANAPAPKEVAAEPNQAAMEPNQPATEAEPNHPAAEPNLAPSEPNQAVDVQLLKQKAEQFARFLSEGKFDEATALFDDKMKQALPAAKLAEVWKQLDSAGGQFKEFGQSRTEKVQGFDVVLVPAAWEKNKLDLKVVFDKQGQVAGFFTEAPK